MQQREAITGQIYNSIPVLRAERSMSRQDLAKALDVSYQTIGYLERGDFNPSLDLAFRISEFFQLPGRSNILTKTV